MRGSFFDFWPGLHILPEERAFFHTPPFCDHFSGKIYDLHGLKAPESWLYLSMV